MTRGKQRKNSFEDISSYSSNKAVRKNRKKKKKTGLIAVLSLFFALLILLGGSMIGVSALAVDRLTFTEIAQQDENLGISGVKARREGVVNIALFGISNAEETEKNDVLVGSADAIAVLSMDVSRAEIKLISLLRDTRVHMEDETLGEDGYDKLSQAYVYGGPELAVRTLNRTYGLDIRDYVSVDLDAMAKIVDLVGGVDLEITEEEIRQINENMEEMFPQASEDQYFAGEAGFVRITGRQAAAYGRIRSVDGDLLRPGRQLAVLSGLLNRADDLTAAEYAAAIPGVLSALETSLSAGEILDLLGILETGFTVETLIIPGEEIFSKAQVYENDVRMWTYDPELAEDIIHSFIYEMELN